MTPNAETLAYRRLAAAVIYRAVLDARSGNGHAAGARRWLTSDPWAGELLGSLGLDRRRVADWVNGLEPLTQLALDL